MLVQELHEELERALRLRHRAAPVPRRQARLRAVPGADGHADVSDAANSHADAGADARDGDGADADADAQR